MNITITHDTDSFFAGSDTEGYNAQASIAKFCEMQKAALLSEFPGAEITVTDELRHSTSVIVDDYDQEAAVNAAVERTTESIFNSPEWYVEA